MAEMPEWLAQVSHELGLPEDLNPAVTGPLLDLVRDVAHGVNRPSGPLTAYLVGVLAGAAAQGAEGLDPAVAAESTAASVQRVQAMVAAHVESQQG